MRTLAANTRQQGPIKRVSGELDESIRIAPITGSIVTTSRPAREWVQCSADRGTADCVEEPLDEHRSALTRAYLERPVFDVLPLFRLKRLGVMRMPDMRAIRPKPTQVVTHGLLQERLLLELSRRGRIVERPRRPRHQRQVCESKLAVFDRRNTLRKHMSVRPNGNRACCSCSRHPALHTQPLHGAEATLPLLLFSVGEGTGDGGELQLNSVDDPA
jgi:hypothetical protein